MNGSQDYIFTTFVDCLLTYNKWTQTMGFPQQLKSLGYLCGLVSEKGPNSEDLNRTVDLLAGLGAERPETGMITAGAQWGLLKWECTLPGGTQRACESVLPTHESCPYFSVCGACFWEVQSQRRVLWEGPGLCHKLERNRHHNLGHTGKASDFAVPVRVRSPPWGLKVSEHRRPYAAAT